MPKTLTPAQERTLPARQALASKFANPEERTAFYRGLAKLSNARRLVLSQDEQAGLAAAYELLGRITARAEAAGGLSDTT